MSLAGLTLLLIGAAHVDRRGRSRAPVVAGASNPGRTSEAVGGAAFNAAAALRAFGATVELVSARGGDAAGGIVAARLAELGIADAAITWLDRATPSYTAILDENGDLVAGIADMELYDLLTPRFLSRRSIRDLVGQADAILIDANLPQSTIRSLAGRGAGTAIAAIGVSPAKVARLDGALPALAALFVSRAEAAVLAAAPEGAGCAELVSRLAGLGLARAIVTDGAGDAAILDAGRVVLQAPPEVDAVRDVTGAGDTLAAVAFLSLREGLPFVDAARLGMAAAARKISAADFAADCRGACRAVADAMPPPRPVP